MNIRNAALLACFVSIAVPCVAVAQQRPLVTEDPETVGANRILIEGGVELDKDQLYSAYGLKGDTTRIGIFGVSVGVGANAEIQVDGGLFQRLKVTERLPNPPLPAPLFPAGDTASGFEDLTVATKLRIGTETETRPVFGLRFGTKLPTAKQENGVGLGTTDFFASFLVAKTVQSVRTVGNIGIVVLGNPRDAPDVRAMAFGMSVARALTNEFEIVGEVNGRLKPMGDVVPPGLESRGVFRLAGRYTYSLFRLDLGVVVGITARDPSFGITAGATYVITR